MKKVGIEIGLRNIAEYLSSEGCSVHEISGPMIDNLSRLGNLDVIVTSGMDTDMLGHSTTKTKTPVLNVSGLTPEEVKSLIDRQMK
ncbi:MAG: YkuS family protein [Tissierellales bacterium]